MGNFRPKSTICQSLSFVPFDKLSSLLIHQNDTGKKKLLTIPLLKVFIASQLKNWRSYAEIEEGLRADEQLREELGMTSISGAQLSRRISKVPAQLLEELFLLMVMKVTPLCKDLRGISDAIGRLKLIDSSKFRLPTALCKWTEVSTDRAGVKVHVRLAVDSPQITYPDKIVPSLGVVDDRRGALYLVVADDVTYVLDRGYVEYAMMDEWDAKGIRYVMRVWINTKETVVEEYPVEENGYIVRDARVKLGSKFRRMEREIRLVEFRDEEGKLYRIVTNRWDLSAQEIAEIYKNRWLIELFFKWIKQHLPAAKIHGTTPQAIWNEMYLAMITYLLSMYIRLTTQTQKTQWQILSMIRAYAHKTWSVFEMALHRKPSRTSRGRQKTDHPREGPVDLSAGVALVSNT